MITKKWMKNQKTSVRFIIMYFVSAISLTILKIIHGCYQKTLKYKHVNDKRDADKNGRWWAQKTR